MRVAVASDVGDSGHKSAALAIAAEGTARGHRVQDFDPWPAGSAVAGQILFQMFRDYAAEGVAGLPPVIEQPGLWPEMVADLLPGLTLPDADALVGTHPWAAGLLAELARRDGFGGVVIGVNTDFYAFPASTHPRIDYYTGVFPKAVLPPAHRARQRPLGIPVRPGFAGLGAPAAAGPGPAAGAAAGPGPAPAPADRDVLLVTVGARAFIPLAGIIELAAELQRALPGARVVVCTGRAADGAADSPAVADCPPGGVEVRHGLADLSPLMRQARLVVSRPSGLTVAEALAAGAVPVLVPSDVPWEADAARHLVHAGLAVPLPPARPLDAGPVAALWRDRDRITALTRAGARLELGRSASRLWDLIEAGRPAPSPALAPAEEDLRAGYLLRLEAAQRSDPMPRTAAFLRQAMLDWYAP
jgi:UDP-N-acetylglucosamine:LPS N-acetylglucosamine transferase